MKDYQKVAAKIAKMGSFREIHNCGFPSEHFPVNLCCELSEAYGIGYMIYVAYSWGKWSIDYPSSPATKMRAEMTHISGIKTDKEMYEKLESVLAETREKCGVKTTPERSTIEERIKTYCKYLQKNYGSKCIPTDDEGYININIVFTNSNNNEDETQFDIIPANFDYGTGKCPELVDLWKIFCKENSFKQNSVKEIYIPGLE